MTTNSNAYFATTLTERLTREFPDLKFSCKGKRLGHGGMRVIVLELEGSPPFQFPFPRLGTHTEEVNLALLETACKHVKFVAERTSKPARIAVDSVPAAEP